MLGGITKPVQKLIKKTKQMILHDLKIKQKPQLDNQIKEISPKTLTQQIKYYKLDSFPIGKKLGFKGLGRSIGRYNLR